MAITLAIRLYRLSDLTLFAGDQGRDAIVIRDMVTSGQPTLLGSVASVGGYHRGPAFYWLLTPSFVFSNGDPAALAATTGLAEVATVVLLALIGQAIAGWIGGLVAAGLWATSELTILLGRWFWNPELLPPFELLAILSMIAISRGRQRWILVLFPAWAIAWQMHEQALLLLPAGVIWWAVVRPPMSPRLFTAALGLAALSLAPFLIYELTHALQNTRGMVVAMLGLAGQGQVRPDPAAQIGQVIAVARRLVPSAGLVGLVLWTAAGAGFVWCLREVRKGVAGALVIALLAATTLLYAFLPRPVDPHYLYAVMPVPFLLIG